MRSTRVLLINVKLSVHRWIAGAEREEEEEGGGLIKFDENFLFSVDELKAEEEEKNFT